MGVDKCCPNSMRYAGAKEDLTPAAHKFGHAFSGFGVSKLFGFARLSGPALLASIPLVGDAIWSAELMLVFEPYLFHVSDQSATRRTSS